MATATTTSPASRRPIPGIRQRTPSRQLADLLSDVKAWARHQHLTDLVQAMTEAQALAGHSGAGVRHD